MTSTKRNAAEAGARLLAETVTVTGIDAGSPEHFVTVTQCQRSWMHSLIRRGVEEVVGLMTTGEAEGRQIGAGTVLLMMIVMEAAGGRATMPTGGNAAGMLIGQEAQGTAPGMAPGKQMARGTASEMVAARSEAQSVVRCATMAAVASCGTPHRSSVEEAGAETAGNLLRIGAAVVTAAATEKDGALWL